MQSDIFYVELVTPDANNIAPHDRADNQPWRCSRLAKQVAIASVHIPPPASQLIRRVVQRPGVPDIVEHKLRICRQSGRHCRMIQAAQIGIQNFPVAKVSRVECAIHCSIRFGYGGGPINTVALDTGTIFEHADPELRAIRYMKRVRAIDRDRRPDGEGNRYLQSAVPYSHWSRDGTELCAIARVVIVAKQRRRVGKQRSRCQGSSRDDSRKAD